MDEPVFEVQDAWERMADGPFTPYDPWEQLAMYAVKGRWDFIRRRCLGEMDVMRVLSGDQVYRAQLWCLWAGHEADIWRAKWDLRLSYALSMWISGIKKPLAGLYIGAVVQTARRADSPMKFSPYTIAAAPRSLPIWQAILDDLSNPPPARVARVLGVGVRTVYRWNRTGNAPRTACLALFWLTRWGRSQVHCAAVNDCTAAIGYARCLFAENEKLRTQLAHVLALSDTGAANGPLIGGDHVGIR